MSTVISAFILLHERDNILIARRHVSEGDTVTIDGASIVSGREIPVGHKVARHAMSQGQKVFRFGAPIGSLTADVSTGEHVHTHNMKSDYIASHDRNAVELEGDAS